MQLSKVELPQQTTTFHAVGIDIDGFIEHYEWYENGSLIAGGFIPQESNIVIFTVGEHVVTLVVSDDDGAIDHDEVVITVKAP